jgi:hypothetical protein
MALKALPDLKAQPVPKAQLVKTELALLAKCL